MKPPKYITTLKAYVPGKPIEELEREYGISDSVKLASNENPLGPSKKAVQAIQKALVNLHRYPDGYSYELRQALAQKLNVKEETIVFGNGSNEIIELLTRTFLREGDEVLMPSPSFLMYEILVQATGAKPVKVPLRHLVVDLESMAEAIGPATRMVFVNNPNNPTGTVVSKEAFEQFLDRIPGDVVVVVDEAYIEFVREPSCPLGPHYLGWQCPVVTLRTFSKAYGLAGLRMGYGIMKKELADYVNRVRQPFNANTLAQVGALAALQDEAFFRKTINTVHQQLDWLYTEMERLNFHYHPTEANFFLIDVNTDAKTVYEKMLRKGVIVRAMTAYGFPELIRVSVGLPEENKRFIRALEEVKEEMK